MSDWLEKLWQQHTCFTTPIKINTDSEYRNALDTVFSNLEKVLIDINADDFYIQETKKYRDDIVEAKYPVITGFLSQSVGIMQK